MNAYGFYAAPGAAPAPLPVTGPPPDGRQGFSHMTGGDWRDLAELAVAGALGGVGVAGLLDRDNTASERASGWPS